MLANPLELMPARYSAYAIGDVDFLIDTTHPGGPQWASDRAAWRLELVDYCRSTRFLRLEILEDELDEGAGRAYVTFRAHLERDGQAVGFEERSLFLLVDGRWKYHSGEVR